ncbi:hypothetical protein FQN54_007867 [Arachnomyces sp. PD_36]|nr:hypothetical protein FQN54_007867 [Arachnomyces sp. PD_36]
MKSARRGKMSRIMSKAGLLPTIKCSNCAADVEISSMGEHVCSTTSSQLTPPPDNNGKNATGFENDNGAYSQNNLAVEEPWPKSGRSGPPPRIDPSAANQPFLHPGELTPANSSIGSRSLSPFSPYASHRSPNVASNPSPQAPPTPFGPPSPELEITDSTYPGYGDSDNTNSDYPTSTNRDVSYAGMQVEDNPYDLVKGKEGRPGLRSHQPSPSSVSYRQQAQEPQPPSHTRQMMSMDSRSSSSSYAASSASTRLGDFISRPSTAGSNHSSRPSLASISRGPRSHLENAPPVPQGSYQPYSGQDAFEASPPRRPARVGGYGGFETEEPKPIWDNENESDNTGSQLYRSRTLPSTSDQPEPPPNQLYRSQTFPIINDDPTMKDLPRDPPRMPFDSPDTSSEKYDTPKRYEEPSITPNNDLLRPAFPDNSGFDTPTPAYSPSVYGAGHENNVDTSNNYATSDMSPALGNPYDDNSANELTSTESSPSETQSGSTASTSPPSEISVPRPRRQKSGADISHKRHGTVVLDPPPGFFLGNPDSPTDPSFQDGRLSNPRANINHERSFTSEEEQIQALKSQPPPVPPLPDIRSDTITPPPRPSSSGGQRKRRCRGCNEFITGKSVSSADGRLTGRYHKSCLVCHTCGSAFLTADFYVLNDHPYCSQHYHELNCSLCYSCNHGIEGQYLETDEWVPQSKRSRRHRQKFHPDCFRCKTCKIVLGGDYFEWYGDVYCERDARRVAAQYAPPPPMSPLHPPPHGGARRRPPPSPSSGMSMSRSAGGPHSPAFPPPPMMLGAPGPRFPERRTTRLMMT